MSDLDCSPVVFPLAGVTQPIPGNSQALGLRKRLGWRIYPQVSPTQTDNVDTP